MTKIKAQELKIYLHIDDYWEEFERAKRSLENLPPVSLETQQKWAAMKRSIENFYRS